MKILLKNETELAVSRINRSYDVKTNSETLHIAFVNGTVLDDILSEVTNENVENIIVKRDGQDDLQYSGFTVSANASEDITEDGNIVNITLHKQH